MKVFACPIPTTVATVYFAHIFVALVVLLLLPQRLPTLESAFTSLPALESAFASLDVRPQEVRHLSKTSHREYTFREFVDTMSGKTCFTVKGSVGGLANTMGFVNALLDATIQVGGTFAYPPVKSPQHSKDTLDLFGSGTCRRRVHAYEARCDTHIPRAEDGTPWCCRHGKGCVVPDQFVVTKAHKPMRMRSCNCDQVVVVDTSHMCWHFDYARTGSYFRKRFWTTHPAKFKLPHAGVMIPGSIRISVAIHVRLGDESKSRPSTTDKHTDPVFFVNALASLRQLFPKGKLLVTLITENPKHRDVRMITQSAKVAVTVQKSSLATDFYAMVYSDVLIAGCSGFPRLAAVLQAHTRPSFRIVIEKCHPPHPLTYLRDTVNVRNINAISIPRDNPSIVALKARG